MLWVALGVLRERSKRGTGALSWRLSLFAPWGQPFMAAAAALRRRLWRTHSCVPHRHSCRCPAIPSRDSDGAVACYCHHSIPYTSVINDFIFEILRAFRSTHLLFYMLFVISSRHS